MILECKPFGYFKRIDYELDEEEVVFTTDPKDAQSYYSQYNIDFLVGWLEKHGYKAIAIKR